MSLQGAFLKGEQGVVAFGSASTPDCLLPTVGVLLVAGHQQRQHISLVAEVKIELINDLRRTLVEKAAVGNRNRWVQGGFCKYPDEHSEQDREGVDDALINIRA